MGNQQKKRVVSVVGIRPDFIRMKFIFQQLDEKFNHTIVHTGQHYDDELYKHIFEDLQIRKPDEELSMPHGLTHEKQLVFLIKNLIPLLKKIRPHLVIFLGDSNSVMVAPVLKKCGFTICHIEAGMRSFDNRMFEEINRRCCDAASTLKFPYHTNYLKNLSNEGLSYQSFVSGNTIIEPVFEFLQFFSGGDSDAQIMSSVLERAVGSRYFVADIHRNEILSDSKKYWRIIDFLELVSEKWGVTVWLTPFNRAVKLYGDKLKKNYSGVKLLSSSFSNLYFYLMLQMRSIAVFSDSGTAQEECPLLGVPVIVPRSFTERPESVAHKCSLMINEPFDPNEQYYVDGIDRVRDFIVMFKQSFKLFDDLDRLTIDGLYKNPKLQWLFPPYYDVDKKLPSQIIVEKIEAFLKYNR